MGDHNHRLRSRQRNHDAQGIAFFAFARPVYSAFTDYCGFRINSGEYKLMGLAPYGRPTFAEAIRCRLLGFKSDGSFWLNMDYFNFLRGTTMANEKFYQLFGGPPRRPDEKIEQRHMDVARSIQVVTEEIMVRLARHAREVTGQNDLCLAGGAPTAWYSTGKNPRTAVPTDSMQALLAGSEFSGDEIEETMRAHNAV